MSEHQTESHSAQFGLKPQSEPTKNAGSGPGTGIEGTSGHAGHLNSDESSKARGSSETETTMAGMATGSSDNSKPGAGSLNATASQGTGQI
jgi:hypothetical protein